MLVFVDESYRKSEEPNAKSTFGAVLIQEEKYRDLDTKLFGLKRVFWKIENSYEFELKGRALLSERAINLPKNREFVSQLVFLCKEVQAVLFAVVQDGTITLASESNRLPNLYRALLWRVNTFMQEKFPQDHAIEEEKGLIFWSMSVAERKRKSRLTTTPKGYSDERRFICPECVNGILAIDEDRVKGWFSEYGRAD